MIKIVTFGELMLRLGPPGFERLLQSPVLQATFGGAEANVAVSLAHFGLDSCYVTRLPPHAIGDAAVRALCAEGVNTDHVLRGGRRIGIYFTETGASQRASTVLYDRAHSAISEIEPGSVDWDRVFAGARWFHWTGITPALGEGPAACVKEAIDAARRAGVAVSVDLNYRKNLWTEAQARRVMRSLVRSLDLVIANEEDIQTVLGIEVPGTDVTAALLSHEGYGQVAHQVAREYDARRVAITLRESLSASENGWQALMLDAASGALHESQRYQVRLVDRIGAGDSFGGALIHGLVTGRAPGEALRFAVAASALKQTIPGDFNRVSVAEVERLAAGDASGRVQR